MILHQLGLQLETYTNSKGETKVKGFVQSSIDAYRIKLEEYLNNKYIQDKPKHLRLIIVK